MLVLDWELGWRLERPKHSRIPETGWFPLRGDWRWRLLSVYLGDSKRELVVRPLQADLELWELSPAGFLIVDSSTLTVLEYCLTSPSPFSDQISSDLYYLGLGGYVVGRGTTTVNVLNGQQADLASARAFGVDVAAMVKERAVVNPEIVKWVTTEPDAKLSMSASKPVVASAVMKYVPDYGYITGCYVYSNTLGNCGWIAGSIITRFWHARNISKNLLPSGYRSGTNLTSSPNFAEYLRGTNGYSTWAPDLYDRLLWNAGLQGVSAGAGWSLGNVGVTGNISNNIPVIIFGALPTIGGSGYSAHAVVAYGYTTNYESIVHYGYPGYTHVVLNDGVIGSNTRFWVN